MLIGRDYLLEKPDRPSAPKMFLDTRVVPFVANIAGGLEVALDRTARHLGVRPALIVAGAAGLASASLLYLTRRRHRAVRRPSRGPSETAKSRRPVG